MDLLKDRKRKNSEKSFSKFKENNLEEKEDNKTNKSLFLLDQTNNYESSVNEKSTFINNNKNNSINFNNTFNTNSLNTNTEITNKTNNNNKNNLISRNIFNKNFERELLHNDKNDFEFSISNEILQTQIQAKNIMKNVKTGQFVQIDTKNSIDDNDKSNNISKNKNLNDSGINNNNEKEDESINKIKDQIRNNLTFFNLLQQQKSKKALNETFEYEEYENENKYNEIISEKEENEGIEVKFTDEDKMAKIVMKQENKKKEETLDEINKEIKNLESKKKNILRRKNTDNIASSFNFRNKVLPNLHISKMFQKEKTSDKNHIKIDKINLLRTNTNKFVNSSSNSNSKQNSINGFDEAFSLKSFKFSKQKTKSNKLLKPDKFGYHKQNSHFSYKSSSSNKNSVFTFQNLAHFRDKESLDICNSLLEVILIFFNRLI